MILRGVTTRTNWPKCHKLRHSVNLQAMARVLVGYLCCKKAWNPQALVFQVLPHLPFGRFLWRWSTDQARLKCHEVEFTCTDQIGLKNFQKCQKRWIQMMFNEFSNGLVYSNVLRPCQCKGSIEYVHLGCLRHWVAPQDHSKNRKCHLGTVHWSKIYPTVFSRSKDVSILQTLQRDPTSTGHWLRLLEV